MPQFRSIILTLYPEMFPGTLGQSLAGKALENGIWSLETINIRDFAEDKHKTVDDSPYGGGAGMVLKPDVVHKAVEHAKTMLPNATTLYTTPRGNVFDQKMAESLKKQDLIILCGRFEGVDQRVIEHHNMQEISLGDFVLSGGEIAAQAMLDACIRLIPGVLGNPDTLNEESFSTSPKNKAGAESALSVVSCESQQAFTEANKERAISPRSGVPCEHQRGAAGTNKDFTGLLEYPQYTRPLSWNGISVPGVLHSGNHKQINNWRLEQAKEITALRRPDLLEKK